MEYQLERGREENRKACREWAERKGLPELEGTEKQVAWADALRYSQCFRWVKLAELMNQAVYEEMSDKILEVARTETDARFYIETRYEGDVLNALKRWESWKHWQEKKNK